MTLNEYNRYCRTLPATTTVVQWGGAHVWKVGGKVFAIARQIDDGGALHVTFKCSAMSYDMLREMPGCRPAPYLASRGMLWIQRTSNEALDDLGLKDYLAASYRLVVEGLPKRLRAEFALGEPPAPARGTSKHPTSTKSQSKSPPAGSRAGPRKGAAR